VSPSEVELAAACSSRVSGAGKRPDEYFRHRRPRRARKSHMARRLLRATGKTESLISDVRDRPGHDRRYALACEKIERELGWKPAISLDEGLRKTIEGYRTKTEWAGRSARRGILSLLRETLRESRPSLSGNCGVGTKVPRTLAAFSYPFSWCGASRGEDATRKPHAARAIRNRQPVLLHRLLGDQIPTSLMVLRGSPRLIFQQRRPHEPGGSARQLRARLHPEFAQ
jgi:hypothetical protein